jgi:hypothetical protein
MDAHYWPDLVLNERVDLGRITTHQDIPMLLRNPRLLEQFLRPLLQSRCELRILREIEEEAEPAA